MRATAVAVACAVAAAAAPAALAHVDVSPGLLESGTEVELLVELPELRPGPPPTAVAVSGAGVRQLSSRPAGTFGMETRWRVRVRVEAEPGPTELVLRAAYADGASVAVRRTVTVVPARDDGDGRAVVGAVAAVVGLGAAVALAVALRARRG